MTARDTLLPEFDLEMATLRKMLDRVPADRGGFRPHEKSMTLGRLAGHLVECPMWGIVALDRDEFDLAPPGGAPLERYEVTDRSAALARFDSDVAKARTLIAEATDDQLQQPWTCKAGGHTVMTLPRFIVLRRFLLNHMIHHRAQLGVYLRLLDIPVPPTYGPSADER